MADRRALEAAKKQGKEAHALEKVRIAKEKEPETAAKDEAKLKAAAVKKAEKACISAEKKAARYRKKVRICSIYFLYLSILQATQAPPSNLNSIPPNEVPPMTVTDVGDEGEDEIKFGLHPDDPANFLKLSSALRILMRHTLSDADVNSADTLIRQYATELLKGCLVNLCHLWHAH